MNNCSILTKPDISNSNQTGFSYDAGLNFDLSVDEVRVFVATLTRFAAAGLKF